jgi:hypothetical protein
MRSAIRSLETTHRYSLDSETINRALLLAGGAKAGYPREEGLQEPVRSGSNSSVWCLLK